MEDVLRQFLSRVQAQQRGELVDLSRGADEVIERLRQHAASEHEQRRQTRLSEERFRGLVESISDWIWEVNERGVYTYASPKVTEILGYAPEELLGRTPFDFMPPEEAARVGGLFAGLAASGAPIVRLLNVNRQKSGRLVTLETSGQPIVDEHGVLRGYRGVDRDVSDRVEHEARAALAAMVFDSTEDGILVTNAANEILSVNRACERITGYSSAELVGRNPRVLSSQRQSATFYAAMWKELHETGRWRGELWNRRKSGDFYIQRTSIATIAGPAPEELRRVAVFSDITLERRHAEEIEFQATHDPLTGLPNRRLLLALLDTALARTRREGRETAVLMLDLDGFKHVNDTLGHHAGDQLLIDVSGRLRECLRGSDTLGRLGGDEFMVVLDHDAGHTAAQVVANKIIAHLQRGYLIGESEVFVTASVGIAMFPGDGDTAGQLIANADAAMYQAKSSGRNDLRFFAPAMHAAVSDRLRTESELRKAIAGQRFMLCYQPISHLGSRRLARAEALVRWVHPERGVIAPNDFIPLAEETGLIVPLGKWIIEEATRQLTAWRALLPPDFRVCVNVSPAQFRRADVFATVEEAVASAGCSFEQLELEITEGVFLQDASGAARDALRRFVDRGATVAIDDFGTGYSSLSYLLHLPIDTIKIDRSFVGGLPSAERPRALVEAIVRLAASVGLDTVAEGIETEEQAELLRAVGCAHGQGYLFSRPVSGAEFERVFLRAPVEP